MQRKKWSRNVALAATTLMMFGSLSGCAGGKTVETAAPETKTEAVETKAGETTEAAETQTAKTTEAETQAGDTAKTDNSSDSDLADYSSTEEVTISLFTTQDHMKDSNYEKPMIEAFEKKYPNITVELQVVPDEQQVSLIQTKLATGEAPDIIRYTWVADDPFQLEKNFYNMNSEPWVARAKETEDLKVPEKGKKAENIYFFRHDLKIEGEGIVYNKAIFEKAGITKVPNNYDEFLAACEKIKAIGVTPFFMPGKDPWTIQIWQTAAMGDVIENVDTELMNDINSGKRSWSDSKEFIEINRQYANLVEQGYTNENILADDYNKAQEEFLNGNYAMIAAADFFMATINDQDPNLEMGIFPVPWRENASLGTGAGGGFFITKNSKHLTEARLFLDFLSQQEQLEAAQELKPYVQRFNDGPEGEMKPYQEEVLAYVEDGKTAIDSNTYFLVDNTELWRLYQDMLGGVLTPEDVASEWDVIFRQYMQDKGIEGF